MITNMELRFEQCVPNLIWKNEAEDPKKRKDHLVFINFGVKKLTVIKTQEKKKTLMFECYNLLDLLE
jgi:helix-turn-helix protein